MEKRFLSKRYCVDTETVMGQAAGLAGNYDDVINLSLGDPDIITPLPIIEQAFEDAKAGYTKYTDCRGYKELREEIAKYYKEEFGMQVSDEEIMVTASGCIAMYLALEAILDDGDEVIVPTPYFTIYKTQIELARGKIVELDTFEEEHWQIDPDRLESCITPKTKVIIINSPNNPTGSCLSPDTMNKIAKVAQKHDLVVISDEIYTIYSFAQKFIPFSSLEGMKERTITINSFSKNFVMTGWRLGMVIAPPHIVNTIKNINENLVYSAPSISQRAALKALRCREKVQPQLIETFRERVYYAAERINQIPNMHVIYPPMGSFYLFINIKGTGLSSVEAAREIFEKAHVVMIPGNGFGRCGEGFLRIACTVDVSELKEAFDRIEKMDIFKRQAE